MTINMNLKVVGAAAATGLAVLLALVWRPTAGLRVRALENQAEAAIARGEVLVSPAELATLMHNRQVGLAIFDLREEPAYNRFHLVDARRAPRLSEVRALPDSTVKVLVDENGEAALVAYRKLAPVGVKRTYVLAGGIPAWLALFAPAPPSPLAGGLLAGALGDRHPASQPDIEHVALPKFEPKVKLGGAGAKKSAGWGG
jgi:rhodanese-related sulfurtransferase